MYSDVTEDLWDISYSVSRAIYEAVHAMRILNELGVNGEDYAYYSNKFYQAHQILKEIDTFVCDTEAKLADEEKNTQEYIEQIEQDTELFDNEDYTAAFDREIEKADHRKSRKAKRNKRKTYNKSGAFLPKGAKSYGKKMLHRYNRRHDRESDEYYKHLDYAYKNIFWDMT